MSFLKLSILLASLSIFSACGKDTESGENNTNQNSNNKSAMTNKGTDTNTNGKTNKGTTNKGTNNKTNNKTTTNTGTTNMNVGLSNPSEVFDFVVDESFIIPVVFGAKSEFWRRPLGEDCPAKKITPMDKAAVPGLAVAYRNNEAETITVLIEMISEEGKNGEPKLDDPFLIVYSGKVIPTDIKNCLAANDKVPDVLINDAEITIDVLPGETITIVGTTFTYSEPEKVGTGHAFISATPTIE